MLKKREYQDLVAYESAREIDVNYKMLMIEELEEYLPKSRSFFILSHEEKISDLVVDGSLPLQDQEKQDLKALSLFVEKIG